MHVCAVCVCISIYYVCVCVYSVSVYNVLCVSAWCYDVCIGGYVWLSVHV